MTEDALGYADDEEEVEVPTAQQWQLEHSLSETGSKEFSRYFQYLNYHLHLIQKIETPWERRLIPNTVSQRLSFYRSYATSPNKIRTLSFGKLTNSYFWFYLFSVIFKILPQTYIQTFLASYSPKHHLYWNKMSPLFYGSKFVIILVSFLEILFYANNMSFLFECVVLSVIWKNPWNRCPPNGYFYEDSNKIVHCYTLKDLKEKMKNITVSYNSDSGFYESDTGELFQISQVAYMAYRSHVLNPLLRDTYCVVILLLLIVLSQYVLFRGTFWKVIKCFHYIIVIGEVFTYLNLFMFNVRKKLKVKNFETLQPRSDLLIDMNADFDTLLETETAPPIIHFLTARSTAEIFPTRDSTIITLSNTVYYLFRAVLTNRLKLHCESLMSLPLYQKSTEYMGWFYLWPIYLSTFTLGDILTIIFFNLQFLIELFNLFVVYGCFQEIIENEWVFLNKCLVSGLFIFAGVILDYLLPMKYIRALNLYGKLVMVVLDCLVLCVFYPLPRFIDDITFHFGTPPYKMRVLSLKLLPFVSCIIITVCLKLLISNTSWYENGTELINDSYLVTIFILPLLVGFVYVVIKYTKEKHGWKNLLIPEKDWGPYDHTLKGLRKDYDSRVYIASQAPRHVSRYMIDKAESKSYKLDICYSRGRTTIPVSEFRQDPYFKRSFN